MAPALLALLAHMGTNNNATPVAAALMLRQQEWTLARLAQQEHIQLPILLAPHA